MATAGRRRGSGGYLSLLRREGDFRRLYAAQLISLGGDWFAIIPLLTLLPTLTGTGLWGGLVLAADTVVVALLSPYAGTVVDRVDRRKLLIAADVVSAALVLLLLLVRSEATAWVALVAIGGIAAAKAFYQPGSQAALPNLVSAADLPAANVLAGASWGTMLAVGAALGGLAAAVIGPYACFVLDSASFLFSAWLTTRISKPLQQAPASRRRGGAWFDLREAAGYVRSQPRVQALLTVKSAVGLGNGVLVLFPLFAVSLGVGALGTGLLFAARGLGAVIGPVALRRWATSERLLLPLLAAGMALYGAAYLAFSVTTVFAAAFALVVVAHIGGGANWVMSTYGLQAMVPDALRGRVFSLDWMVATLAIGSSQAAAGVLSGVVGERPLAAGFAAITLGYGALWGFAVLRSGRASGRQSSAPTPAADPVRGQ